MRVTCRQEDLSRSLSTVSRAVATRSPLPILSNIVLRAIGERLELSATNLEIGIACWLTADVGDEGGVAVPARLLSDFVNSLPPGEVVLEMSGKSQTLNVSSDRFRADIRGIDPDEFPTFIPDTEHATSFALPPENLREIISQVTIAAATDESRPVLTGVLTVLDPDAGHVILAAADGFRLSVREAPLETPLDGKLTVVIPARTLLELARACGDETQPVQAAITTGRNQIVFRLSHLDLVSLLIDGNFPDYERIVPQTHTTRAVINTRALFQAARVASFFARDAANVVRLSLDPGDEMRPGTLTVSAQAAEVGANETEVEAAIDGDAMEIAFNAKYLLDVLGVISADQVALELSTPSSPGVFKPVAETPFTHVIMPMHIAR